MKSFTKLLVLLSSCILSVNAFAQAEWTYEDRAAYARKNLDSTKWNMKMFRQDLEGHKSYTWPTSPAISSYPSPVAKYDWGYGYLGNLKTEINGLTIEGKSIGYAKGKYRPLPAKDSSDFYINYFNIFIVSDLKDQESGGNAMVSRNYPHYLSTGKKKTSMGSVDWLQMSMADGNNFAVINQRYFDLEFGKTIFVLPLKDGSLRFLQVDDDHGSIETLSEGYSKDFLKRIKSNKEVIRFLNRGDILE